MALTLLSFLPREGTRRLWWCFESFLPLLLARNGSLARVPAQRDGRRHRAQLWKFFAASLQHTAGTSTARSSVILGSSSRCPADTPTTVERIISVLFSRKEILQFVSSNHW